MALDGVFLYALRNEIAKRAEFTRVDKVFQPSRYEIYLLLRGQGGLLRLCLSAAADSPRIHFTGEKPENPAAAPMFCMLLRKHLAGGRFLCAKQPSLERVLTLKFECLSELGDTVIKQLVIEVMGKHSNILLVDKDGRIIDAIRHVDLAMSSRRQVLPGLIYEPPPPQNKLSLLECTQHEVLGAVLQSPVPRLDRAILSTVQGLSPVLARELCHRCCGQTEPSLSQLGEEESDRLKNAMGELRKRLLTGDFAPALYRASDTGQAVEFCCLPLFQYGALVRPEFFSSPSALLEKYYAGKARRDMLRQRAADTRKLVGNAVERLSRKLDIQRAELARCADRETDRLYGDLITANLHRLCRGDAYLIAEDFSHPDLPEVKIPLELTLSPAANAQQYYKRYTKAKNAEAILRGQLAHGLDELLYLESVMDSLEKAQTAAELSEIREELSETGYIRRRGAEKRRKSLPTAARTFVSSDGFTILVGRNNLQNDRLTLKTAQKQDIWLHVKGMAGSHVVVETRGQTVPRRTLAEAAQLAAYYSKASMSDNVPVDCTQIRYVKKPAGAKPGMVVYEGHHTLFVTPGEPPIDGPRASPKLGSHKE